RPERVAAAVAHPVFDHLRLVTRSKAEDLSLAMEDLDVAARRTARADGRRALQVPDARLEAELATGERADGADVDDVLRVAVVEPLARGGVDEGAIAARERAELARLRHFVEEAGAAQAENAALLVEHHARPELDDLPLAILLLDWEPRR